MAKRKSNQLEGLPLAALAEKEGRVHKDTAFRFQEGLEIRLEKAEANAPRKFRMIGLSGKPFAHPWWGLLAFDMKGLKASSQKIPILRQHDPNKPIGFSTAVEIGERVEIEGVLSASMQDAQEVTTLADEGFPWQASVGLDFVTLEFVQRDAEAEVNGAKVKGPATVFRKATVRETSFVPLGADPRTHAEVLSAADPATLQALFAAYSTADTEKEGGHMAAENVVPKTETPPVAPVAQSHLAAAAPAQPVTAPAAPMTATLSSADVQRLVSDGVAAGLKALKQNRTARLEKLRKVAFSNQESLCQQFADSDESLEDCMVKISEDARARGGARLAALQADPAKGVQAGNGDAPASAELRQTEEGLITGRKVDETKAKALFGASESLQSEFRSETEYLAYLKAFAAGRVKFAVLEGREAV
jgi:hypothetical protein